MQLAQQLNAAGVSVFPCLQNKNPAVPKGTSWLDYSKIDPQQLNWPSQVVGVPIPAGVTIIDLDTYKGVTREQVEQHLGCALPWDQALIQHTQQGGEHYAFRVSWDVKQGSNLNGITGLDTRVTDKGYIATGGGYTPVGFGLFRLGQPQTLPELPEATRPTLEHVQRTPTTTELPEGDKDVETIRDALRTIAPGLGRSEWLRVGLALRHQFHDDEITGASLFEEWSSGQLWPEGAPHNYDPDGTEAQFYSFKPEGGITISTLFYAAMQNGWRPPAGIDVSAAFGPGAAPIDEYYAMFDRIEEYGSDPRKTDELLGQIDAMKGNALQREALLAAFTRAIKEAGLLTKALKQRLDGPASNAPRIDGPQAQHHQLVDAPQIPTRQLARPDSSHGDNAQAMIREVFGNRLAVISGQLRWWSGREWQTVPEDTLDTLCFHALSPGKSTATNVSGTKKALAALAPKLDPAPRDQRVFFQNGVLDLSDPNGILAPHDPNNRNTGVLSVDYAPDSSAPIEWGNFVASVFEGEEDGEQRRDLLQEIIGYCLFKDNLNVQKAIALDGATRAGKGIALEVIANILGPQSCGAFSFVNLANGKTQSTFRRYDVLIDMEAKPPMRGTTSQVVGFLNKVASNEMVSVELLNTQDPWSGRLNAKMIISCNGIPTMIDDSGASANRFHILKYTRSFEGKEDKSLLRRLTAELPAITAWAISGARRLIANNGCFTMPATSTEAGEDLKGANQPLREFLGECGAFGADLKCHSKNVWAAYQQWAVETNTRLPTRTSFYKSLHQTLLGTSCTREKAVRIGDVVSTGYYGLDVRSLLAEAFTPTPLRAVK